jgi:putative hydrolase of the HAD superfamily
MFFKRIFVSVFFLLFFVSCAEKEINIPERQHSKKYTTVVFDIGGVLLSEPYARAQIVVMLKKFGSSLFSGKFFSTIINYKKETNALFDPQCYPIWDSISLGVSERQAAEKAIEKVKEILNKGELVSITKEDITSFFDHVRKYTKIIPRGLQILKKAKEKGYKVYLLSNISKEDHEYYLKRKDLVEIFRLADGGIMSYKVKANKPDAKIYNELLKAYNLKPEECLFLDNRKAMVDGARKVGIDGIVCDDHEKAIEKLEKIIRGESSRQISPCASSINSSPKPSSFKILRATFCREMPSSSVKV